MLPVLAQHDKAHEGLRNAVLARELCLRDATSGVTSAKLVGLCFSQLREAMFRPTLHLLGCSPGPMLVSTAKGRSACKNLIAVVLLGSPRVQMLRVDAWWIVALVQHPQPRWYRTVMQRVRIFVRLLAGTTHVPVPVTATCPSPEPTCRRLLDMRPEVRDTCLTHIQSPHSRAGYGVFGTGVNL
jgi:hypothetical protein